MKYFSRILLAPIVLISLLSCANETVYQLDVRNELNEDVIIKYRTLQQEDSLAIISNLNIYSESTGEGNSPRLDENTFRQRLLSLEIIPSDTSRRVRPGIDLRDFDLWRYHSAFDMGIEFHSYTLTINADLLE